jgi:hypothetical protein
MSLNAMARPAVREPGPLVTLVHSRTVENVDSIGLDVFKCASPVRDKGVLMEEGLGAEYAKILGS